MKALIKRFGSIGLLGKADSGHWVPMDASPKVGGYSGATGPLELVLIGLGGCTGMDVLSILAKKRVKVDDFEVEVEADRAEEHPKTLRDIKIKFIIYGEGIKDKDVARAIELSETTYCSVAAMLRDHTTIETSYEIRPPR
jgi:putative redox protein